MRVKALACLSLQCQSAKVQWGGRLVSVLIQELCDMPR